MRHNAPDAMTANYLVTKHILSAQLKVPHVRGAPFQADADLPGIGLLNLGKCWLKNWHLCLLNVRWKLAVVRIVQLAFVQLTFVPSECSVEVGSYVA